MFHFSHRRFSFLFVLAAIALAKTAAIAQDETSKRSELGLRQKLVERRMAELENKLTVIADRLREKEPERAARLVDAYQQSKELLITRKMAEVIDLLDQGQLPTAEQKLNEVVKNLESLIRILVDQKAPPLSKEQEMQMLEKWKEQIAERLKEQQSQRQETEKVADKEKTVQDLEAQIKKLQGLIEKQKEVIQATEDNKAAGLRALDQVADKQFEIRQATEQLKRELGERDEDLDAAAGDTNSADQNQKSPTPSSPNRASRNAEAKEGDSQGDRETAEPSDSESGKIQPAASDNEKIEDPQPPKSADAKPSEAESSKAESDRQRAGDSKPGDSKPGDSKPGDSKPGDSKSGESKSSDSSPPPPQPGQQPLQQAAEHQLKAEEKLSSGQAVEAKRQEQEALANLEQALNELQKEKRRIESLPPEALEQMADEQRRTRDKAMELVEEMKQAPKGEDNQQANAEGEQPSSPGQQSMEQAGDSMQQASKDLQQQDPQEAKKEQKQAENKMQQAVNEIEDRLNQLREETREEKLARLEARFQEMLQRQVSTSVMTVELDDRRTSLKDLRRRDQLLLLQLSNEELEISEIAQQAYDLLLEDGTSVVFPEIVQELRQELDKAAQLLQAERTDQVLQLVQKEIEFTVQDLLDALKEAKNDSQNEGGGGGGGGGENPLLKKSAELKILRMQQLRLNRRAKRIEQIRGPLELETSIEQETQDAAVFQQKLLEMLEGILEKEGASG
jgi:hypothetical protein